MAPAKPNENVYFPHLIWFWSCDSNAFAFILHAPNATIAIQSTHTSFISHENKHGVFSIEKAYISTSFQCWIACESVYQTEEGKKKLGARYREREKKENS